MTVLKTKDSWERVKLALMMQSLSDVATLFHIACPGKEGMVIFTTCAYPNPKGLNKATP